MTKMKITFVVEFEYEAKPENYPESHRTPEKMLELDLASANDDPFLFLGDDCEWQITGEVLE